MYTDFSKKIILNKKNIYKFLNRKNNTKKSKDTDLLIGFFGYELLNNLIGIKVPRQKNIDFPKGIFYKPERKISFTNNLNYKDNNSLSKKSFKININRKSYSKIFDKFKKKLKLERPIRLRFVRNIKHYQK